MAQGSQPDRQLRRTFGRAGLVGQRVSVLEIAGYSPAKVLELRANWNEGPIVEIRLLWSWHVFFCLVALV